MKIKFLISCLFILLLSNNSFAKSRCDIFYEKIKQNSNLLAFEYAMNNDMTLGFNTLVKWNPNMTRIYSPGDSNFKEGDYAEMPEVLKINKELEENNKELISYVDGGWDQVKSKDGYPLVGKILTEKMINKVKEKDSIISINGKDLREFDFSVKKNEEDIKVFHDYFGNEEELIIVLQRKDEQNKIYQYTIKSEWSENNVENPFIDLFIRSVSINEKDGTFNITLATDFSEVLNNEFLLTKWAREILLIKKDGEYYPENCDFTKKKWHELKTIAPNYGIKFENLVYLDKSLYEGGYLIELTVDQDDKSKDELEILYKSQGEYKFRNKFQFKSFPFDRQQIKVFMYQSRGDVSSYHALISDFTKRELLNFQKKNNIISWNIVDNNFSYKLFKGPNNDFHNMGVELTLDIERKSDYYIKKIIFPIFIILTVCWSALWVNRREIESRLTITIVCLLSLIAYNFVIDSEMPKLEYLTIMDYIILVSYVYAAIPNFLSVATFDLMKKNKKLADKIEIYGKRYGLLSYVIIIFITILVNTHSSPENTNAMLAWMVPK
jgi:hypothetical protein